MNKDEFCNSYFFRSGKLSNQVKIKFGFKASYLSINVQLSSQALDLIVHVRSKQDKLRGYKDFLEVSNENSLHFTFVGIAKKECDEDLLTLKSYVQPYEEDIKKIIEKEKVVFQPFSVCLKYAKATPDSIFYFCSFEKNLEEKICLFQKHVCDRVFELIKRDDLEKLSGKNNCFGNPVNITRWKVPSLTTEFMEELSSKGIFTCAVNEEQEDREIAVSKNKISTISLTYSNQFWTNPDKNTIKKFTL